MKYVLIKPLKCPVILVVSMLIAIAMLLHLAAFHVRSMRFGLLHYLCI